MTFWSIFNNITYGSLGISYQLSDGRSSLNNVAEAGETTESRISVFGWISIRLFGLSSGGKSEYSLAVGDRLVGLKLLVCQIEQEMIVNNVTIGKKMFLFQRYVY